MGILILGLNILSPFLKERKMNMSILQIISIIEIIFCLALFTDTIRILYKMYKLEKHIKETEQDKPKYEIWLEEIDILK